MQERLNLSLRCGRGSLSLVALWSAYVSSLWQYVGHLHTLLVVDDFMPDEST